MSTMRHYIAVISERFLRVRAVFFSHVAWHTGFWCYGAAGFLFLLACLAILFLFPPLGSVRYPQVFIISKGETVRAIGEDLRQRNVVNSPSLFILSNYIFGGRIVWGSYHFNKARGVLFHAHGLYVGDQNMPLRKVTIPEQSDAYAMADIFEKHFSGFDRTVFLETALKHHGYLYPDTYLFSHTYGSVDHLVEIMTETFNQRTFDLFDAYTGDLSRDEIVTLASIVELEASRFSDRRKIAQVLLNRLAINMPLQVDVSFLFIEDKNTFQLSRDDLDSDDPSNTYKYAGIPPIPITNPSRASIEAVMNPEATDALYFLADFYGNTYYSKTFAEHLRKKARYIDSVRRDAADTVPTTQEPSGTEVLDKESGASSEGLGEQSGGAVNDGVVVLPSGSTIVRE